MSFFPTSVAPSTSMISKTIHIGMFLPIVRTKTFENGDENGDFRKVSKVENIEKRNVFIADR